MKMTLEEKVIINKEKNKKEILKSIEVYLSEITDFVSQYIGKPCPEELQTHKHVGEPRWKFSQWIKIKEKNGTNFIKEVKLGTGLFEECGWAHDVEICLYIKGKPKKPKLRVKCAFLEDDYRGVGAREWFKVRLNKAFSMSSTQFSPKWIQEPLRNINKNFHDFKTAVSKYFKGEDPAVSVFNQELLKIEQYGKDVVSCLEQKMNKVRDLNLEDKIENDTMRVYLEKDSADELEKAIEKKDKKLTDSGIKDADKRRSTEFTVAYEIKVNGKEEKYLGIGETLEAAVEDVESKFPYKITKAVAKTFKANIKYL